MTRDRRSFLKLAGVGLLPGPPALWEVRALVRGGSLGRVVFCRAPRGSAGWIEFLVGGAAPVCERIAKDELVLCGTEATLVIDRKGYRRFA